MRSEFICTACPMECRASTEREEIMWELDACQDKAERCRVKNRQLIRGY